MQGVPRVPSCPTVQSYPHLTVLAKICIFKVYKYTFCFSLIEVLMEGGKVEIKNSIFHNGTSGGGCVDLKVIVVLL